MATPTGVVRVKIPHNNKRWFKRSKDTMKVWEDRRARVGDIEGQEGSIGDFNSHRINEAAVGWEGELGIYKGKFNEQGTACISIIPVISQTSITWDPKMGPWNQPSFRDG